MKTSQGYENKSMWGKSISMGEIKKYDELWIIMMKIY